MSKFFKNVSKVLGRQVPKAVGDPGLIMRSKVFINLRGQGPKGVICQSPLNVSKVPGRQVPQAEVDPGFIMRFEFLDGLSE